MHETIQEKVWIPGPRGRLAGELSYPAGRPAGGVLLLSPHPYMGGRMRLPLMNALAEGVSERGLAVLRFDYSGVGESEGPPIRLGAAMQQFWDTGAAPDDPLHLEEAVAARAWLARAVGGSDAVVGYSFGAFLAARISGGSARAMVLIAPTIARHDYGSLAHDATPVLVLYGDGDFATGEDRMSAWAGSRRGPTVLLRIAAGDHFFRGQERRVAAEAGGFLCGAFTAAQEAAR